MWYKAASVEDSVNKVADGLIRAHVNQAFSRTLYRFPSKREMERILKIVKNRIKNRRGTVYQLRKDSMESKIKRIVDQALEDYDVLRLV